MADWRGDSLGNKTVNLAKVLDDLSDNTLHVGKVANVELVGLCLDAILLCELLDVLLGSLLPGGICDGDISTLLGTSSRGLNAHAARAGRASDDNNLALEAKEIGERLGLGDSVSFDHYGCGCAFFCGRVGWFMEVLGQDS